MPRKKNLRRIVCPPAFEGYKPYGVMNFKDKHVDLFYEEYEAIKLADYDMLKHNEAAVLMGISRPTFARIYDEARKKIAKALVETKGIKATYGNVIMDSSWYICEDCRSRFSFPESRVDKKCPLCTSKKIYLLNNK